MLKAVKMASVRGTVPVCVCVCFPCSFVSKEAATVSSAQIWAFALVLPVKTIYVNQCGDRSEATLLRSFLYEPD